jgi:hypothetical protein
VIPRQKRRSQAVLQLAKTGFKCEVVAISRLEVTLDASDNNQQPNQQLSPFNNEQQLKVAKT